MNELFHDSLIFRVSPVMERWALVRSSDSSQEKNLSSSEEIFEKLTHYCDIILYLKQGFLATLSQHT